MIRSIHTIKIVHSLIWLIMVLAIFQILFSGITGEINWLTFFSIGLILFETIVLLFNHWSCPLTILAKNENQNWQDGDDIFLPKVIAIHNKSIFGSLFVIGVILVMFRVFSSL